MSIIWILNISAGVTGFCAALLQGRKAGTSGILLGVVVGTVVGFGCFLVMRGLLEWLPRRLGAYEEKSGRFGTAFAWLLCLLAFLWIVTSAFLGTWFTRLALAF